MGKSDGGGTTRSAVVVTTRGLSAPAGALCSTEAVEAKPPSVSPPVSHRPTRPSRPTAMRHQANTA